MAGPARSGAFAKVAGMTSFPGVGPALASATGYDPEFLATTVSMPTLEDIATVLLPYTHFSVLFRPDRRLAAVSSVMIDGASVVDIERSRDVWALDPRLPEAQQTGELVYAHNDLDRGHLTRRRDPGWGEDATQANADTFHYTNAAPQAAMFNQSKQLWNGLEDYLLTYATANIRRLVVHTGPVLDQHDQPYRGILIPRRFFKVVGFLDDGQLSSVAYVLDQSPQLDDIDLLTVVARRAAAGEPPPLGPYRTYQVPVADVITMTGLAFGELVDRDRYAPPDEPSAALGRWRELGSYDDMTLTGTAYRS